MKLSSRFRYGLRLLVELAENYQKGPILLKNIAECEKISKKYLEQIVIALKNAGIVRATRGSKGGYYLIQSPQKITVAEIYRILEGSYSPVDCLDNPKICSLKNSCQTRKLWSELSTAIEKVFDNLTLVDLLKY
jgi:Rrf2 family cysteine metabolism transcriptional repressor